MKTFLTLLVAITSLSASTLVGVHAECAVCPPTLGDAAPYTACTQDGITACGRYKKTGGSKVRCYYNVRAR
ncbi:hypothetical protein PAXRUDRAFT_138237 [Paxillus rubicundulus Ve08.2h10]|uniref:Uncharacterized protein n=1 Tax=Paxillus rubicundulus Ve08.2h10 TaxID=930991 RepID=A0A0D0E5B7_9AGAM|nr:hypothetical protein PAXRUDRAFT_138237 [Paxillus rubicundulus Ve08.2h10]